MNFLKKIGAIGQSSVFVTVMAHMWFAFSLLGYLAYLGLTIWISAPLFFLLVLAKEYILDLRYEVGETPLSSTEDMLEYLFGIALAILLYH